MRFKIVNKKVFFVFVSVVTIFIVGLVVGIYFLSKKIIEIKKIQQVEINKSEDKSEELQNEIPIINAPSETGVSENQKVAKNEPKEPQILSVVEYENTTYQYRVQFPENWQMNNDDSESKIEKTGGDKDFTMGGQTYWSNYDNINNYNPKNKPDDFHLLALTIYKDDSKSVQDFAEKMGIKEISIERVVEAKNISGFEYVAAGVDDKNPNITAIFQGNGYFYVFKPAFINGDEKTAEIMEGIVKSLSVF